MSRTLSNQFLSKQITRIQDFGYILYYYVKEIYHAQVVSFNLVNLINRNILKTNLLSRGRYT